MLQKNQHSQKEKKQTNKKKPLNQPSPWLCISQGGSVFLVLAILTERTSFYYSLGSGTFHIQSHRQATASSAITEPAITVINLKIVGCNFQRLLVT